MFEFSLTSSSITPVLLFIVFLVVAKIVASHIVGYIFRDRSSINRSNNNMQSGIAGIMMMQQNDDEEDRDARRRSAAIIEEIDSNPARRRLVLGAAAVVWILYVCLLVFNYERRIGRLKRKPLEDFRKFPGTKSREVEHPDSGLGVKPYWFCYLLGGLVIVSYLVLAVVLRYGIRAGEVGAALAPTMAAAQQLADKKHRSSLMHLLCRRRVVIFVVGLVLAVLSGLAVTAYALSNYMLYCNYKQHEFERLCDFAHEVKTDVESVTGNGTTWLHNGGLLAAWRPFDRVKNGFIANDHDFDMCIERENFEKMKKYLSTSDKYYFSYWLIDATGAKAQHPQKVRIYPQWSKPWEGHSGMWCVDIDECHYRHDPLVVLDSCNGHFWHVPSKRDSIAYFQHEYPQGPWNKSIPLNHWGLCALLPGF